MRTIQNILKHEFIGLEVHVEYGTPRISKSCDGMIIHETKNTFVIRNEQKQKPKTIPKVSILEMNLRLSNGVYFIKGSSLLGKPEDRIFR
ncbi:MAG: ribonuclease P protein subunit [Nitrososphaerota archaeon]